jgi:hypothetical protein
MAALRQRVERETSPPCPTVNVLLPESPRSPRIVGEKAPIPPQLGEQSVSGGGYALVRRVDPPTSNE